MRNFVSLIVICIISGCSDTTETDKLTNENNWYYVQAMGCMLPIPREMVLKTEGKPYFFYDAGNNPKSKLLNIFIQDYDEDIVGLHESVSFDHVKNTKGISLIRIERDNSKIGYMLTDEKQSVLVGVDINAYQINHMYESCISNLITNSNLRDEGFSLLKEQMSE